MIDLAESLRAQRLYQRQDTQWGPMCKTLDDLKRYEAMLADVPRDALLIETGAWTGASAKWFAHHGLDVVSIDREPVPEGQSWTEAAGWVQFIQGDSADGPDKITAEMASDSSAVYVVLDSDHSKAHVLWELEAWAHLVTVGAYLVVEDTITEYMTPKGAGYVGTPLEALREWLPRHGEFMVDTVLEDMFPTTQCPGGWLLRQW